MGRIAGDDPGYAFRICRSERIDRENPPEDATTAEILAGKRFTVTEHGFDLPSVSTIIGEVLAKPPSAMAWWGYRIGIAGVVEALADGEDFSELDAETFEEVLKVRGISPNMSLDKAGDRGSDAHEILEMLADGKPRVDIEKAAAQGDLLTGAEYCAAAIDWWDTQIQPNIESGYILQVLSEVPVYSLTRRYAGTFDLAIQWAIMAPDPADEEPTTEAAGWEILDAKTHKPAQGFTKPGKGPGYVSDATQCRAYRMAFEEMGLGHTIGNRTIVLRDKAYRGQRWLEDHREVPTDFWLGIRALYEPRKSFEAGE